MSTQKRITLQQINETLQHNTLFQSALLHGSPDLFCNQVREPEQAVANSLCFVSDLTTLENAVQNKAAVIIINHKLKEKIPNHLLTPQLGLISVQNISLAMSTVLPLFDDKKQRFHQGIHATAIIASTAKLGKNISIGAYSVIGDNCQIADNTIIGSHVVIESMATLGSNCILHPFAFVGSRCQIGSFCEIHPHTTIGSDGFGFAPDQQNIRHKIPQIGIVVVEDNVEFGANCAIDRATLGETRIGKGTKFDNNCHIAHNCKIGQNNVFAAGFMMAGSSQVGNNCMFGGQAVVTDHVKVGDNVIVGGKAAVTKDTLTAGAYTGYPLEPIKDAMKTLVNMTHVTEMRKQLNEVRKHLNLEQE